MGKIYDFEQGSEEWKEIRLGRVTGSRVSDLVAKLKSGAYAASRADYCCELVAERLTGEREERFITKEMAWGTEHEGEARATYGFMRDVEVTQVGFVMHDSIEMAGSSPDGFVGEDGLVEIKCPKTTTHIKTLFGAPISPDYVKQMMWQMATTGRKWVDFVSYDPRLPRSMMMHVQRVHRDPAQIVAIENEVRGFLAEVDAMIAELTQKFRLAA